MFHRAPASAFSSSDPAPCSLSRSPSLFLSARSIFHHPTEVSTRARTITAPLRPPPPISHYMICFACSVSTRFYSFMPRITLSGPFAFVPSPFSIHHHSLTPSLVLCTAAIDGRCLASPFPRFARIGAVHAAAPCPPSPRTYHRSCTGSATRCGAACASCLDVSSAISSGCQRQHRRCPSGLVVHGSCICTSL